MGKHFTYYGEANLKALQAEFDRLYPIPAYTPTYTRYGIDYGYWYRSEEEGKKMENKITEWCVRGANGGVVSWHSNKAEAVRAAEKTAAASPGNKYFVCRVVPETMSVTNNVTTKDL